jgi:regulation of enolase protein 1 (concanavalin A-like superfamily)
MLQSMQRLAIIIISLLPLSAADVIFRDDFKEKLAPGWKWIREDSGAWRITADALEVRIQPGNMWGPENSGKNILVRPVPDFGNSAVEISMTVQNRPTGQYEQVDLVWYYDDSHMVKIGQEIVDEKLCIVMGREHGDKTRTIAIIPLGTERVDLKLRVEDNKISGFFRPDGLKEWQNAGNCDLPVHGKANVALQCYQGPADKEHWARIQNFVISKN